LPALRIIPFLHWNGLARTDSVLAYYHRGWPTASVRPVWLACLAYGTVIGTGQTSGRITGQRYGQGENMMAPLQAILCIGCGARKNWELSCPTIGVYAVVDR